MNDPNFCISNLENGDTLKNSHETENNISSESNEAENKIKKERKSAQA